MRIGTNVYYHKYEAATKDREAGTYVYPSISLTEPDAEGKIQLAFYHPQRGHVLGGSDWRDAIDRAVDVLPDSAKKEGVPFWSDPYAVPESSLPSEVDLDTAVAVTEEEEKAKEATKGKNGKAKPVAVGK